MPGNGSRFIYFMLGIMPEQVFADREVHTVWDELVYLVFPGCKIKNLGETNASSMETFIISVNLCLECLNLSNSKKKICKKRTIYKKSAGKSFR